MEGEVLFFFGGIYRDFVYYLEVIKCLEELLEIFKKFGKCKVEGELYWCFGMIY